MRLDKLLAHNGYGSRKDVKRLIRSGWVSVNGEKIISDDYHVDPNTDEIWVNEESVALVTSQTFLMNKPKDTICSQERSLYPSILDLIQEALLPSTQPVGRLDVDTTGLILITNDGQLAHHLLSPKHHVSKVYEVSLATDFDLKWVEAIEKGIMIDQNERCLASLIEILEPRRILLTLFEGKYHQVKRMMKACENEVVELKRIKFGPLILDDSLELGAYRSLTLDEIEQLKHLNS